MFSSTDFLLALNARHGAANVRIELGQLDQAISDLAYCLHAYRDAGLPHWQARVLNTIALYHIKKQELSLAEECCNEGLRLLEIRDQGIPRGLLYRRLAQVHLERDNRQRAKELLQMSLDLLKRVKAYQEVEETSKLLSEAL